MSIITLAAPFVAQQAFQSDQVVVLKNEDDPVNKRLKSLVELGGNPSFHFWVEIYDGPGTYDSGWTDDDVANAVRAWFAAEAQNNGD